MATGNLEPLAKTCLTTMEIIHAHPGAFARVQEPRTYDELQKFIDSKPSLNLMYKPPHSVESLDNCTQTPNNNTETDMPFEQIPVSSVISGVLKKENEVPPEDPKNSAEDYHEELSICVDSEEESGHSWRPSLANSLSPDFFLPPLNPYAIPRLRIPGQEYDFLPLELPWESGNRDGSSGSEDRDECDLYVGNLCHSRHDLQSYMQSQKAELNILKYEVMNARRKIIESRSAIESLTGKIKDVLKFQNSQEIEKLTEENAQLRLECQCLCMEVDFYLKGKAPLGEIDENFYKETNAAQSKKAEVKPQARPQPEPRPPNYGSQDQEEGNKWQCHVCTFANHPAIYSCEMCHMHRLRREPVHCSSQDTCFCHPKEHAQSS